jgi:hypothetical protein
MNNQTAATTFFLAYLSGGWQWRQELGGDGLGIVGGPGVGSSQRISPWPGPTFDKWGGPICQHGKVHRFTGTVLSSQRLCVLFCIFQVSFWVKGWNTVGTCLVLEFLNIAFEYLLMLKIISYHIPNS